MKKIQIMLVMVLFNIAFYACTPQQLSGDNPHSEVCCGEEGSIPPPPPPPPGG